MKCNIDARGKSIRLLGGCVMLAGGLVMLLAWLVWDAPAGLGLGGAALSCGGGFVVFEGAAGWCALRAMGVRTPV